MHNIWRYIYCYYYICDMYSVYIYVCVSIQYNHTYYMYGWYSCLQRESNVELVNRFQLWMPQWNLWGLHILRIYMHRISCENVYARIYTEIHVVLCARTTTNNTHIYKCISEQIGAFMCATFTNHHSFRHVRIQIYTTIYIFHIYTFYTKHLLQAISCSVHHICEHVLSLNDDCMIWLNHFVPLAPFIPLFAVFIIFYKNLYIHIIFIYFIFVIHGFQIYADDLVRNWRCEGREKWLSSAVALGLIRHCVTRIMVTSGIGLDLQNKRWLRVALRERACHIIIMIAIIIYENM